jgi:hypothetical protein
VEATWIHAVIGGNVDTGGHRRRRGVASTAALASHVIGPYSVLFLLSAPSSSCRTCWTRCPGGSKPIINWFILPSLLASCDRMLQARGPGGHQDKEATVCCPVIWGNVYETLLQSILWDACAPDHCFGCSCSIMLFGIPVRIVVCRFIGVLYMRNEGKNWNCRRMGNIHQVSNIHQLVCGAHGRTKKNQWQRPAL